MTWITRLLAACCALIALPAAAQTDATQTYQVVVTEWVEVVPAGASRFVSPQQRQAERESIASYGPFRVLEDGTAALVGVTDSASPRHFAALLAAHPEIAVLTFIEAPGTQDDVANMQMGRMIRARGMETRVEAGGSVRSGAVELFLAGAERSISDKAEFAVHGWLDYYGMGAQDYPANAPEHRRYLDYYAEMGMEAADARAFYAMTNSVPFDQALWLSGGEMRAWLGEEAPVEAVSEPKNDTQPRLAYLDLSALLQ